MNEKELELMTYLMSCSQEKVKNFMERFLIKKYGKERVVSTKDYILSFGDLPIALIGHLDTVFEQDKKFYPKATLYYDRKAQVLFSPFSPGFDDRVALFIMIHIISKNFRPTIILCCNEEQGMLGAKQLVKEIPQSPIELRYLLELDRANKDDFVTYSCDNKDFNNLIASYGFNYDLGSYSDIAAIGPAWGIASVNVSCGYVNEHSYGEILHVNWMWETVEKVKIMLNNCHEAPAFKHIEAKISPIAAAYGLTQKEWDYLMSMENEDERAV